MRSVRASIVGSVLMCGLLAGTGAAQTSPAPPDTAAVPSNAELARRIDLLAREMDDAKLGDVAGPLESQYGLGPAASKVYQRGHGVSIGGYGEMLASGYADEREDGTTSTATNSIDYLRQILYVGYKFDDRLLINSEIEFEHATTGQGGSVSVEFAYLDALLRPEANLRAGLVLVPLGLLNELHEPPIFLGTRRPETERRIIPTTWRANGVGVFGGTEQGLVYRAYFLESLDATGFAGSGVRNTRQSGSEALFEDIGGAARLDYQRAGILVGASAFYGGTAQNRTTSGGAEFEGTTTIWDVHADAHVRGVRFRALVAGAHVDDAAAVNDLAGLTGNGSVGEEQLGWYVEAGYDLLSRLRPGSRYELVPYVRYEELDTQREVPAGFLRNPANDDQITTAGASFYPHPQVVVKGDYQWLSDEARSETDRWNIALGFLF